MATILRQVLNAFENFDKPLSQSQLARELGVAPGMLESMITYWIRKGKLRETSAIPQACTSCGTSGDCAFVVKMPRMYELVRDNMPDEGTLPPCSCSQ